MTTRDTRQRVVKMLHQPDLVHAFLDSEARMRYVERELEAQEFPSSVIAVKDLIHVDGFSTRAGLPAPIEFEGAESSLVSELRSKGSIVAGKTALDQLAYDSPPVTVNPLDHLRTPGGSSFGSAAAAAAGLVDIAIATQTSSSLIGPAAFCGLFGFKPSSERSRSDGFVKVSPSLDVMGFLARNPQSLMQSAPLLLEDWNVKKGAPIDTVGIPNEIFFEGVNDYGWKRVFDQQIEELIVHGYKVKTVALPWKHVEYKQIYEEAVSLIYAELAEQHGKLLNEAPQALKPPLKLALNEGVALGPRAARELRELRSQIVRDFAGRLIPEDIDAMVSPSQLGPAPFLETGRTSWGQTTLLWSYFGLPALNIPAGLVDSMPVGLQFVSRWGEDERLIAALDGLAKVDFSKVHSDIRIQVPRVEY